MKADILFGVQAKIATIYGLLRKCFALPVKAQLALF